MFDFASTLLGIGQDSITWWQMLLRAVVVYSLALAMIRIGDKRFLGKNTAFDVILGVVLGSVVSRAITNSSPFIPTLVAAVTLVALHWSFGWISFRWGWFGTLIKGNTRTLVQDGEIQWDAMRKSHMSEDDLLSALRSNARVDGPDDVRQARLERSGSISILTEDRAPRIVSIDVRDGVQTVRVELAP